ncbi:hypothetical protein EB796_020516 [Bugula neritina]|uniref:CDC26 n=1 Tax=Bugula neritina TaxID=10212 RepID=A0A7J7J4R4_BUGNE|nr:hypothetical protein EB796_020516 [Bugula neritina]
MLRRPPQRIELRAQDVAEWEERKKERELEKKSSSPPSVLPAEKSKAARTAEINERIGYNPDVVEQPTNTNFTLPHRL